MLKYDWFKNMEGRKGGGRKEGRLRNHILALFCMPEYARVCQSMQKYARVCKNMPENARVCQSMLEYARVCLTGTGLS